MMKLKTAAALCAATLAAFAASYASGHAQPPAATVSASAAAADTYLADRHARLLRTIRLGRMEGWLDRDQARTAYRTLRGLREREAEMRTASAGELRAADRDALKAGFDDLARDLRWARMREAHARYRSH